MDKSNKIVIWGHKHYTDTASYFLVCIFRTFQKLGYDVYWFDDRDHPSAREFDYNNCIFFIDNQSGTDINCPVVSSGIYISWDRFRNLDKYLGNVKRLINMRVLSSSVLTLMVCVLLRQIKVLSMIKHLKFLMK